MYNVRKSNNPILRKLSDTQTDGQMDRWINGQIDRQADGQTDKSDFTGHFPTNVKHPKTRRWKKKKKQLKKMRNQI